MVQEELENELERLRSQLDLTKQRLNLRENDLHQVERNHEKVNCLYSYCRQNEKK